MSRVACRNKLINAGNLIRKERKAMHMTVAQLAGRIGLHRNTITNYEAGKTEPSSSALVDIAGALGCPIDDFFKHLNGVKSMADFWKRPPSWDKDKKEWSYPWPKLFLAAVRVVEREREYWDIQVARIYFGDDEPYLEANGESWALIEDVLWISEIKEPDGL